jgi:hypothetical protein
MFGGLMIDEAKFNRFSISEKDFGKAEDFLAEAKKHQYGCIVHEALVFSAIICYFRPFTENEKNSNSAAAKRLDLSDFRPLSQNELEIHENCKELRNKALAHAEIKYHPTKLDSETGVISSALFSLVGRVPNLDFLAKLIKSLREQCDNARVDYVMGQRNAPYQFDEGAKALKDHYLSSNVDRLTFL